MSKPVSAKTEALRYSGFGFIASFVIRHSSFRVSGRKSPKTKLQAPEKLQTPNPKDLNGRLEPEFWSLSEAWNLFIGASAVRQCGIPS